MSTVDGIGPVAADLRRLVEAESTTGDLPAVRRCARVLTGIGDRLFGPAARRSVIESAAGPIVQWRFGAPPWRLGLIGHYDTVHAVGTLAAHPYCEVGDVARGPGVHDMKGGLVAMLSGAATALTADPGSLDGVVVHCAPDEENGSSRSRPALAAMRRDGLRVAAVYEGTDPGGGVVTSRKGGLWVEVTFSGRGAHGSRPEEGANALPALAEYLAWLPALADASVGTTVVPTRAHAGTAINAVPGRAVLTVDCRTVTQAEQDRVLAALTRRRPSTRGVDAEVAVLHRFPPMTTAASASAYAALRAVARSAGLDEPPGVMGTGVSDASHLSAMGVRVVDGLGPVGGGDHSPAEWVSLASVAERARLTALAVPALRGAA
jgi:glutamate carboxypeptidase